MTGGAGDQIELREGDGNSRSCGAHRPGFLARLRRSQAGNVLPMMAMAIIPLAGLVGGGVDMSRMYIAKSRLQQACDAGALAGRKVQGAGAWDANGDNNLTNDPPRAAALQFFDQNYPNGLYGTTGRTRAYTEAAGRVTGTASVTVPMMIMKMFGYQSQTINVACDAEMRLPNTDVMFVLDNTGSMAWDVAGESTSRIASLRLAVNCFYEVVARLDIPTAACPGPAPSGGTSGVQIRFGFMPYATNVNVGKLLPNTYFANDWSYQSRQRVQTGTNTNTNNGTWPSAGSATPTWGNWSTWSTHSSNTGVDDDDCNEPNTTTAYSPETSTNNASTDDHGVNTSTTTRTRTATQTDYQDTYTNQPGPGGLCLIEKRTRTRLETRIDTVTQTPIYAFHYKPVSYPIGTLLKNGTGWNSSFQVPIASTAASAAANKTITWDGCIEERIPTRKLANYSPIPNDAYDLQIDLMPNPSVSNTLWGPALPGLVYNRPTTAADEVSDHSGHTSSHTSPESSNTTYACPEEAKKLQAWTASNFESYVNGLAPEGSTYHDIGLLWGARFMSPTGIFRAENEFTPQGGAIDRHMIFMTDGETCATVGNYIAYGLPRLDMRQTDTTPTDDLVCPNPFGLTTIRASSVLNAQVDARFSALCTAVKNQGITLWVVYFGTTDVATTTRMTNCASPSRFYPAASTTTLINTFRQIADQISQLRLTR